MQPQYTPKDAARFWLKVDKSPHPKGCWLWTAFCQDKGYGMLWWHKRPYLASRASYEIAYGDPGELFVLHRCDNPQCVNPEHLFLGTQVDNMRDCQRKNRIRGTFQSGEDNPNATVTDAQMLAMQQEYAAGGTTYAKMAKKYGISKVHFWRILRQNKRS